MSEAFGFEIDRSLVGEPLFLHIDDNSLDESIEKAANIAANQPEVQIIAVRFSAEPRLRPLVTQWLGRQRKALAAWRVQQGIISGRLTLRSRQHTDRLTGSDLVWAYVEWKPAKMKGGR